MEIIQSILTNSDCYRAGRKITVKGLMIHSIGTPQPDPMVFVRNWNRPGVRACVHAFVGANGKVYQTLPWNHRGWHGASGPRGSVNNTHIGVEMTEPNTIIYTGGSTFRNLDAVKTRVHVMATYSTMVELFAELAKDFKLDPLRNIISHAEGYKLGLASNHGDPEHLWRFHGLTMNGFRAAVKAKMEEKIVKPAPAPLGEYPVAYKNQEGENVKILQRNLVKVGILKAADVDGIYGSITSKAVELFQRSRGIEIDGQAGAVTQSELKKVITALEAPKPELPNTNIPTVKEEPLQGTVKIIYKGKEGLNVRKAPNFDDNSVDAVVRFGEVFTVVAKAGDFYKLKSGLYITTNELFVEFKKPVVVKPKVYKTTTNNLNMRKGPAVKYERILTIPQNTKVEILESTNGWDKVSHSGKTGWVSAEYLKSASVAKPVIKSSTVKINTGKLNVRKDPTTASKIVGSVKEGEVFTIVETKDGWGKLKSGLGWIYLDYTTKL